MTVQVSAPDYAVDGRRLAGFLADGSNGASVPGILVVHEGRGFTQHARDRAVMLAELGYVAYAPDFMGGAATSLEHATALMRPFDEDRDRFRRHGEAALNVLRAHRAVDSARLGAIGFCWGGFAVLELACHAPMACTVAFHPGLSLGPLSRPGALGGSVLVCVGDRDPYVPMSDVTAFLNEMNGNRVDAMVLVLAGAPHSFSNPEPYAYATGVEGVGYDHRADRRSWAAMQSLFAECLPL